MAEKAELDDEHRTWLRRLEPYRVADDRRAAKELLATVVPLAICLGALWVGREHGWMVRVLATLPAAGLLVRLFIIQHDCGHGSFFASRRTNDLVGGVLGFFTLAPYAYWRRTHQHHHANHGRLDRPQLGGLDTRTVRQHQATSRLGRLGYRLYRNPLVLLLLGPVYLLVLKHRLPLDAPLRWRHEWKSVVVNDLALLGLGILLHYSVGLVPVIALVAPVYALMWGAGIWLFYVQHQFEGAYWRAPGEWRFVDSALQGSSFLDLPTPLRWLTGNIGYHHIHHLSVRIPLYRLPECHEDLPALHVAPRLGLRETMRCWRLALWDDERGQLVGFGAARATAVVPSDGAAHHSCAGLERPGPPPTGGTGCGSSCPPGDGTGSWAAVPAP